MSKSEIINYPPEEILNPTLGKSDYEYIILWMLNNNEICKWSDFTAKISESTLSGHLKKLISKGFIDKPQKGEYSITLVGGDRFNDLALDKKTGKRRLKYPPKVIMKRRNYDHWILWMVYNNYSCRWSDFKQPPVSINQSSLSNNINSLISNKFVIKENKEYVITPMGKTEYFTMLKLYDMDRQSILEQESKRIEEITEKTREFFNKHKIKNEELQFRYLDHILKLSYAKVESMLKNEEEFNLILLFLSSNHPYQYPDYISLEDFSSKYNIDITTLNYYIREIVDNQFFQIKFFKLLGEKTGYYYFQKGEPIEKILNAIVEKYITKFTYLNKFQENPTIDIDLLLEAILNDVCGKVFNDDLKGSLKTFLPDYIKYLAYTIETERKLIDREAKLEGFVWQNIFEEFQQFEPSRQSIGGADEDEPFYSLKGFKSIFEVLNVVHLSKFNFLRLDEDTYNIKKVDIFNKIEKLLYREKITKAREVFDGRNYEINTISQLILRDVIVTADFKFEKSLDVTTEIIKKFPNDYIGYLFQSLTYLLMDDYNNALKLVEEGLDKAPHIFLKYQKVQILIKQQDWASASSCIEDLSNESSYNVVNLQLKFWISISEWYHGIKDPESSLEMINAAIKLSPGNKELIILKSLYYCKIDRFRTAKRFLIKEIDINVFNKNLKIDPIVYFILATSHVARGKFDKALKIANQVLELYPNHSLSFLTKALVFGYNLIYKFKFQEPNIDTFKGLIRRAISLDPIKSHKAKYLNFQGYVLLNIKENEEAIDAIDEAIEILPESVNQFLVKIFFLTSSKRDTEALELIEETVQKYPKFKRILYIRKQNIYWAKKQFETSYDIVNELSMLYPNDIDITNNKALILASLNRRDEAIETAEHLISIDPNHGNPYDTYGEIFQILGEYEEAIKKFEEALKIEPKGWFIDQTFIKMGECYEELGMYEHALESYKTGKIFEDRRTPTHREYYGHRAEKRISDIKEKMIKIKKASDK